MRIDHVIVLHQVLAHIKMVALDPLLHVGNRFINHGVLNGGILIHAHPAHKALDAVATEAAHDVVLQGHVEAGTARVTLPAGPAPELVVNAPCLMALRTDDVQSAPPHHLIVLLLPPRLALPVGAPAEHNVNTAPGHIGRHGHRPRLPRPGDDTRLLLVEIGIKHLAGDTLPLQKAAQVLRPFNRHGAD
ncbi:hypothetical protein ES703_122571 [subsurface metagenome]